MEPITELGAILAGDRLPLLLVYSDPREKRGRQRCPIGCISDVHADTSHRTMSKRGCNGRASIGELRIAEAGAIFAEGTFREDAFEKQASKKEKPAGMYRR